ncbi:glycoside hydrolase family 27 protein [Schizophyllum commune]
MRDCKESFSMDHGDREKEVAYGSSTPRVSSPGSWLQRPVFQVTLTPAHVGMAMLSFTLAALFAYINLLARPKPTSALDNGVGRLPSWNAYVCDINETVIRESADLLVSLGLKDLGYNYMNIDDCYAEKNRTEDGDIIESAERFPSGMRNLTDYIHDLGLKAGIYSDSGWFTCQLYPGSFQNEERDIKLFRETWNFDLLKYDNCAVPFDDIIREGMVGKFTRMADAIAAQAKSSGKDPILFSLCQFWSDNLGWRLTSERRTGPHWDAISSIINQNSFYTWSSDFYGHGDMDIVREAKSHFTAWALMKSPLLILSKITKESLAILTNTEIIGINQDSKVGTAITPFRWGKNPDWTNDYTYPAQYWSGESENGTVVMLLNVENEPADMFFTLAESPWIRAGRQYSVRDLWSHTDNGTAVRNLTVTSVPAHGVVALLLKDAGDEPSGLQPPCSIPEWCIDQNGTRVDQ